MEKGKNGKKMQFDKTIVISGINLFEGGGLSIFYDCLDAIRESGLWEKNRIIAFVHKKDLFERYSDIAKIIELPKSRKNYLYRLYYEYLYFAKFSKKNNIDIWFSIHDITPRVRVKNLYTYCHNASPFFKCDISKIRYSWKVVAFSCFYKYLYKINISNATGIIVQQDWMRKEFEKLYGIKNIIVASPQKKEDFSFADSSDESKNVFIYPSLPRFFKNFEILLEACKILEDDGIYNYEAWITIDGTENRYASELKVKYGNIRNIKWLGRKTRNELFELYNKSNYMVFSSKLESWGLPISEYKMTGKPVILADLPYAHEALGDYDRASFFDSEDAKELSTIMRQIIQRQHKFSVTQKVNIAMPYYGSWKELMEHILS